MTTELKKLLENANVLSNATTEEMDTIISNLEEEGVEVIEDVKFLDEKQIKEIFNLKPIQAKKLLKVTKSFSNEKKEKIEIKIPTMPTDFNTIGTIEVTGNKNVDMKSIVGFVEFGIMYGMGVENIGNNLIKLLTSRMDELDEPVTEDIVTAFKTIAKFENFDNNIATALDFNLSLLPKRHNMATEIRNDMMPNVVEFINEAMDFRLDVSDINTLLLKKSLNSAKVSSDISADTLVIAAEELAMKVARNLRGLNSMVVQESLKLYKELFELINDSKIQKFVGASDSRDMLIKIGVKHTPKEVALFQKLPELVYQMLYVLKQPDYLNNDEALYTYLQNIWSNAKLINWAKFGQLNNSSLRDDDSRSIATKETVVALQSAGML